MSAAVELAGVSYAYPDAAEYVLEDLDLVVPAGSVTGIVGASSAGKTTLAKVISGFIPHAEGGDLTGTVAVDGVDIPATDLPHMIAHVGLITQNPFNQISGAKFTVLEELAFGLENLGLPRDQMRERCEQVSRRLGLGRLLDRSPYELSGGQQQLVAIASMLVMRTPVLVMDEPTSQLDPSGTRMVFDVIDELARDGTTIVLFEHKVELLHAHCQSIGVLYDGHLVRHGPPGEVFADARLPEWGVGPTRFTLAVRASGVSTVAPVSLEGAVAAFTAGADQPVASGEAASPAAGPTRGSPASGDTPAGVSIAVHDLRYRYPSGLEAVCGVDLDIAAGERVAIVGQNGAGKTTLVRHLVGIFTPTEGTVAIDDVPTTGRRISDLAATVGYVFQNPDEQIFARTVAADVRFGPTNLGYEPERIEHLVAESLRRVGLAHAADTHPLHLSLSERKRVALAGVLAMDTPVVVLDEPTTGQDFRGAEMIGRIIAELHDEGRTVLAVTHDMDFCAEHFDRIVAMAQGRVLADGPVAEVFGRADVLAEAAVEAPQLLRLAAALGWEAMPLTVAAFARRWAADRPARG